MHVHLKSICNFQANPQVRERFICALASVSLSKLDLLMIEGLGSAYHQMKSHSNIWGDN